MTIWLHIHTSTCAKSSSSSSVIPALTRDNNEDVLEPASDATEDKPDRQSSSSSSGGRSSHRNGFPSESLEHKDSNNLETINKGFKKAQQQRCTLPWEPEADVRFQKPRKRGLEGWTCQPEAPNVKSPTLTASWIWSRWSRVQIPGHACKIANCFTSYPLGFLALEFVCFIIHEKPYKGSRPQNSPHFCVFKYSRAVKQKVWNEADNRERDWGETLKIRCFFFSRRRVRLASFARVRLIRHGLPIFFTDFDKKTPTVLQSTRGEDNYVSYIIYHFKVQLIFKS